MLINNLFSGLLNLILGLALAISLSYILTTIFNIADTETQIFLGVIFTIVIVTILLFHPIESVIADDGGRVN